LPVQDFPESGLPSAWRVRHNLQLVRGPWVIHMERGTEATLVQAHIATRQSQFAKSANNVHPGTRSASHAGGKGSDHQILCSWLRSGSLASNFNPGIWQWPMVLVLGAQGSPCFDQILALYGPGSLKPGRTLWFAHLKCDTDCDTV